jgi:hypothetical protein
MSAKSGVSKRTKTVRDKSANGEFEMASLWKRPPSQAGAQLAAPATPPPAPQVNVHSVIGGNGQHLVLPPRTGGQPWVGHKGNSPQLHAFGPAETFAQHAGGVNMPNPTQLRATVPAVINSITGNAAGTHQLAPGGGVSMPAAQKAPGSVGQ